MSTARQLAFSHGEITPSLWGRPDLVSYATGLRTGRNVFVRPHGTLRNRAGTAFTGEVYDSTKTAVILPFIFSTATTYEMIFNAQKLQWVKNGSKVYESNKTVTAITQAAVGVVTSNAHGYANGDEITLVMDNGSMEQLNYRQFIVSNKTANTFELQDMGRVNVNTTSYTAFTTGIVKRAYTISTPYADGDISSLQFAQSADTVFLVHPSYFARELLRTSDTSWALNILYYYASCGRPTWISAVRGAAGANTYTYQITLVAEDGEESEPAIFENPAGITGITKNNPGVVTTGIAHGLAAGDRVYIREVQGMTEVNGREFIVNNPAATTFELYTDAGTVDTTNYTTFSVGGTVHSTKMTIINAAVPTGAAPNVLTFGHVGIPNFGAVASGITFLGVNHGLGATYNIYRLDPTGVYGFIGTAPWVASGAQIFNDTGLTIDLTVGPPVWRDPFDKANYFPSVAMLSQQRLFLAAPNISPETVYMSQTGHYRNFMVTFPSISSDAVTATLVGKHVNPIKGLAELGQPIAFSNEAEWAFRGDANELITPSAPGAKAYSYNGSSAVPPLIVDADAIYNQSRGSSVRSLSFDLQVNGYRGRDLTVLAKHLFEGHTILSWAYQRVPDSVLLAVRDDGILVCLSYVRDQELVAWTHADTSGGVFEWISSVPEGTEDAVYVTVKRTINGRTVRYIERFSTRLVSSIIDSNFMDCAQLYDGRNTTATTMTLSGGATWVTSETLTLTSSASFFIAADVGNSIFMTGSDGAIVKCVIIAYTNATTVSVHGDRTVPASLRTIATATWSKAKKSFQMLWNLEGKAVSALGDGNVVASVNNGGGLTVSSGTITTTLPCAVLRAGLPVTSDVESLDIEVTQSETLMDKRILINKVWVFVEGCRGFWIGSQPPSNDAVNPLENLEEMKVRNAESYDSPVSITTAPLEVTIPSTWHQGGRIFCRNVDPLPMGILELGPAGLIPIRSGA